MCTVGNTSPSVFEKMVRARTRVVDRPATRGLFIIGENLNWRFCYRSPIRQIKALAKISRYTVVQLSMNIIRYSIIAKTTMQSIPTHTYAVYESHDYSSHPASY